MVDVVIEQPLITVCEVTKRQFAEIAKIAVGKEIRDYLLLNK